MRMNLKNLLKEPNLTSMSIPGPPAYPLVGCLTSYLPYIGEYNPEKMHIAGRKMFEKYGPVVLQHLFGDKIVFLFHPDDIERVLKATMNKPDRISHSVLYYLRKYAYPGKYVTTGILTENGKDWERIRKTYQKNLTKNKIKNFVSPSDSIALMYMDEIYGSLVEAVETDFLTILFAFACDVVGDNIFGIKWDALRNIYDPQSRTEKIIHSSTRFNQLVAQNDLCTPKLWKWIETADYQEMRDALLLLERECEEILMVKMAKKEHEKSESLFDMWLKDDKVELDDFKIFLVDMLLASIDTTALMLAYTLYFISIDMRVQNKLYEEINGIIPNDKDLFTQEELSKCEYLKNILQESGRLIPVSLGTGRVIPEDMKLGGYLIPKGMYAVTMTQVASRLPNFIEKPDDFIPERFSPDSQFRRLHPFLSLPFGYGARGCIGRRFAEQNVSIFIIRIIQKFRISWRGKQPLDCFTSGINTPDCPLLFHFQKRH